MQVILSPDPDISAYNPCIGQQKEWAPSDNEWDEISSCHNYHDTKLIADYETGISMSDIKHMEIFIVDFINNFHLQHP